MKKILITGAFGQLGEACLKNMTPFYNILATGSHLPLNYNLTPAYKMNIANRVSVEKVVDKFQPDIILNLAAMTNVDGCELDDQGAQAINVNGVKHLRENFGGHFIQISTDYIFDGKRGPYGEDDDPHPLNVYGRTKLEAEQWLMEYGGNLTILRTNVVYGYTNRTEASFVKWIVDSLGTGEKIKVVDDQWNNPTWAESLAQVIRVVINNKESGLFNYGGAELITRLDFSRIIATVFELDTSLITPITTAELNQPAQRPLKSGLKIEKIKKRLGIKTQSVENCLLKIRSELDS